MRLPAARSVPPWRRIAGRWVGCSRAYLLPARFCVPCDKLALRSAEDARGYMALMMRSPHFEPRADDFSFAPYECPHLPGMWHVGHHRATAELLKGDAR